MTLDSELPPNSSCNNSRAELTAHLPLNRMESNEEINDGILYIYIYIYRINDGKEIILPTTTIRKEREEYNISPKTPNIYETPKKGKSGAEV